MLREKQVRFVIGIALFLLGWLLLVTIFPPERITEIIGVTNAYVLIFLVATFGGFSSVTAASYLATLITLILGGANPILLAVFGGVGLSVGDSFFYFLGWHGRKQLSGKPKRWSEWMQRWIDKQPLWAIVLAVFAYAAFAPIPNDIMMIALALSSASYKHIVFSLVLGNIIHTLLWGYLALFFI